MQRESSYPFGSQCLSVAAFISFISSCLHIVILPNKLPNNHIWCHVMKQSNKESTININVISIYLCYLKFRHSVVDRWRQRAGGRGYLLVQKLCYQAVQYLDVRIIIVSLSFLKFFIASLRDTTHFLVSCDYFLVESSDFDLINWNWLKCEQN